MSINGIGSYQTAGTLYAAQTQTAAAVESDGDPDRSRVSAPTNATGKSDLFTSTISQTLFQIGVTPAAANVATGAAPANPQYQALNSFVQNLFGALQPAATGKTSTAGKAAMSTKKEGDDDSENDGDESTVSGANQTTASAAGLNGQQSPGAAIGNNLESRLQGLIQQVASANSSTTSDSSEQPLAALQQSYQGLLSSQGVSSQPPPLVSFLQALAKNLQDVPPTGNLISTTA